MKHPHRLMLEHKKTWRCTLPGCTFFVHLGLAHILPGKSGVCWNCGEIFTIDEVALRDDLPFCEDCRANRAGELTIAQKSTLVEVREALAKQGVESEDELTPLQKSMLEMFGKLPKGK